jgi:hypothetical protein
VDNSHFPGHQQAIIKNNIVAAVLSFESHDKNLFEKTFLKFDHDSVVDLCEHGKDAVVGASWTGEKFNVNLYESWTLNNETLEWDPPIEYPENAEKYFWNEDDLSWVEIPDPSITDI